MTDGKSDIDGRLAQLLTMTVWRDPDATIELTVVVDGAIISGSVVSGQAWERRQNDQVRIGSPEIADALDSGDGSVNEQKLYLHFLAPVLVSGGVQFGMPPTRVDLRRVSAWSIGRVAGEH
jgi:hypothetical protein